MATSSWPAVGDGGLTETQWASGYDAEDGIINDYMGGGVRALTMTRDNTANTCTISPGQVRVSGYTLAVTSAEALSCPAVSVTTTYTIAAQYDPALNVADGSGDADPLGPCRLIITNTTLDTSGGKQYFVLYTVTRTNGQVLTASAVADRRKWIGPVVSLPDYTAADTHNYPCGTLLLQSKTDGFSGLVNMSLRVANTAGTALEWQNLLAPPAIAFPAPAALVGVNAQTPPQYYFEGAQVHLRGTLKRASNAKLGTGADVTLGTMPSEAWPEFDEYFCVTSSGNANTVGRVRVQALDGNVALLAGGDQADISWVSLNNISYRARS